MRRGSRQNESAARMNRALGDMGSPFPRDQQQLRDDTYQDSREPEIAAGKKRRPQTNRTTTNRRVAEEATGG